MPLAPTGQNSLMVHPTEMLRGDWLTETEGLLNILDTVFVNSDQLADSQAIRVTHGLDYRRYFLQEIIV